MLCSKAQTELGFWWLVAVGSDRDGEQWEKQWSSALVVTEIPSGSDSFLAELGVVLPAEFTCCTRGVS